MTDSRILPWKIQQYCLQNNDNTVGPTTSLIRSRLSKESLQQRLIEIAQGTIYYDNQLNELLESGLSRDKLQESWDQLTHESDEIEHVLKHKFGMKGGGRVQICQEEIIAAIEMGTQFGSKQEFQQNHNNNNINHNHLDDTANTSDAITDEDEEVNSDIDSEKDIDFECEQSDEFDESKTFQNTITNNHGTDNEAIHECMVRRKPKQSTDPSNQCTKDHNTAEPITKEDNTSNKTETTLITDTNTSTCTHHTETAHTHTHVHETRNQKFKRLEKNWSKNRRYIDPFKGDGLLSKLGEFYEKQHEEQKRKRGKGRKRKKKTKKQISPTPQLLKAEQFCYKLGTVKIHIENEHLDGVKPEDIMPFIPAHCIQKVSDSQFTYHLPVVLEYFKTVTDIAPKARRRRKKRRKMKAAPLEGFKIYYVMDDEKMSKIYLGTIKHCFQSDSILSLLIQLSQNCGALTHRCQIILEQQYISAQDEDIIEMMNENKSANNKNESERTDKNEQKHSETEIMNKTVDNDGDIDMEAGKAMDVEYTKANKDTDGAEIVRALLLKYPDLMQWLQNKPNYHNAVQTNNTHAQVLLSKLMESQGEWKNVIQQLIEEINVSRRDKAMKSVPNKMPEPFTETETEDDSQQIESDEEEYIGSDEFVSGLLMVTVYLSRDVFVKKKILKAIKHIKAFDALLDILQDRDEVVGITEGFPLPINDKTVNKQHVNEFDTGLLYEKLKPTTWKDMCVAQPSGMVSVLWNYQRKAVQWMLLREKHREMVPNLLWREMQCDYEDINDATNNQRHAFWFHIDEGRFDDSEIPQLLDVRGGILADQMGLGKTVECLALINLHKQVHWAMGKPVKSKCIILDEDEEYDNDMDILLRRSELELKEKYDDINECVEPDTEALEQYEINEELLCESAATLIVTPTNILHQWKNEIMKHSPHLKVYIYLGMKAWQKQMQRLKRKRKHKAKRKLSAMFNDGGMNVSQPRKRRRLSLHRSESIISDDMPLMNEDSMPLNDDDGNDDKDDLIEPNYRNLGKYDIVLTDYNVLKAESDFSNPLKYTFRRKKRHEIPDTPLLQIRWWRLILDEAQQIESKVSKCAQMALKVTSKHKWCVTGTPIGKNGLDDLYGLIKFLGVRPFNSSVAWLRTVAEPYYNGDDRRMFSILKRIMWRQAKHHVAKELNIPPRTEEFIELTFCGVEHEYYKKLHDDFMDNLKNEKEHKYQSFVFDSNTYRKKDKAMLTTGGIKQQLEILRQACCHPQISRQTFLNTTNRANGGIMTMKQIMTKMIEDANDRMTQDERELSRAGTYYSDWLIYRNTHKLWDNPEDADSELSLILFAIKILEEVYKVEQSGIDNIETEMILSSMANDSIRCDHFTDLFDGNLPMIQPNIDMNEDEKLKMMIDDLNEGSLSPHKPLKISLSVTPPKVAHSAITPSVFVDHSDIMTPPKRRTTRVRKQRINMNVESDMDTDGDDGDEDYIPPQFEHRNRNKNRKSHRIYDSDTDSDEDDKKKKNDHCHQPILTLPRLTSLSVDPVDMDLNLTVNDDDDDDKDAHDDIKEKERTRLQLLKLNDNVAVYVFGEWQPAVVIGRALNEVIVRFTHFDERGHNMDQLLRLDPDLLSIEQFDDALKCAKMKQIQRQTHVCIAKDDIKSTDTHPHAHPHALKKNKTNIRKHYVCIGGNSRTKHKTSVHISETNEKFYQWKKCEIATSHHLKYLYQQLLNDVNKYHLSPRDVDILNQKVAVMCASLATCLQELQEQSEMKVANCKGIIEQYEIQIDQWYRDLSNIKEICDLVKLRSKVPIKQWQKKHFNRVHSYYNKYIVQKEEMQRKLQYSCFKLRSINLRRKLTDWIPSFPSIWDRINAEFRNKFLLNEFESKIKLSPKSMHVIKSRHTLSEFLMSSLTHFERRMLDIYRNHRDCADAINHSDTGLTDQVQYYRLKWNDLSDITTLFRVFVQISEDHKKLAKYEQELKDTEEKIRTHCAIVDDFDIQRWTVVGIENHLGDRYNIWKQKALGKSQQLRYLQQKHEILLNAGCRVDQECSICQQRIRNPTLTPCGHLFCEQCILAWLQSVNIRSHTKACPQCRYRMTEKDIFHVAEYLTQSNSSYIHSSITSVFNGTLSKGNDDDDDDDDDNNNNNCSKAEQSDHSDDDNKEVIAQSIRSGTHIDNIDIVGKGDYGTKIESLVKYIKYLSIEQQDAKSLVYSQFNQLLSIIAALLHENGIECIHQNSNCTLSRQQKAKRIERFQTDPAVKVLLLSLRTDSSGLTLIQATHVFLLEPSLNEAIELQAIDRVHRVGQTKPTFVHRYFMKATVEDNILRQRYNKILNTKNNKKNKKKKDSDALDKGKNTEQMTIEELMKLFGNN